MVEHPPLRGGVVTFIVPEVLPDTPELQIIPAQINSNGENDQPRTTTVGWPKRDICNLNRINEYLITKKITSICSPFSPTRIPPNLASDYPLLPALMGGGASTHLSSLPPTIHLRCPSFPSASPRGWLINPNGGSQLLELFYITTRPQLLELFEHKVVHGDVIIGRASAHRSETKMHSTGTAWWRPCRTLCLATQLGNGNMRWENGGRRGKRQMARQRCTARMSTLGEGDERKPDREGFISKCHSSTTMDNTHLPNNRPANTCGSPSGLLLVMLSALCGISGFIICVVVEAFRAKPVQLNMTVMNNKEHQYCYYSKSGMMPMVLAIVAFLLFLASVLMARRSYMRPASIAPQQAISMRAAAQIEALVSKCALFVFFILLWALFVFAELFLLLNIFEEAGHLHDWTKPKLGCEEMTGYLLTGGFFGMNSAFFGVALYIGTLKIHHPENRNP